MLRRKTSESVEIEQMKKTYLSLWLGQQVVVRNCWHHISIRAELSPLPLRKDHLQQQHQKEQRVDDEL